MLDVLRIASGIGEGVKRVVEIGTGTGGMTHSLLKLAEEFGIPTDMLKIVGVDYSRKLIADTRTYVGRQYLPITERNANSTVIFHQGFLEHFNDTDIRTMSCFFGAKPFVSIQK